jgi:hypothetical protein
MRTALRFALLFALSPAAAVGQGWDTRMESLDAYLMDEAYEVTLARSAAPEHVAAGARVLVLRSGGYHEIASGSNGFTCLVERSWSSPIGPHIDFYNPKLRAPICYNAEATRTILGDYMRRTELALGGASIGEIQVAIERDVGTGKLRAPQGLAMSYMLSGEQLLGTNTGRFVPHLMFYVAYATADEIGSPPPGCEHICMFEHVGGPLSALIVPMKEFNEVQADASH